MVLRKVGSELMVDAMVLRMVGSELMVDGSKKGWFCIDGRWF